MTWIWLLLGCISVLNANPNPQLDGSFWWQKKPTVPPTRPPTSKPKPTTEYTEERIVNSGQGNSQQHQQCTCVPYYQCNNGEIITDGAGIIDIRLGPNDKDTKLVGGNCPNILDVCCKKAGILPTTSKPIHSTVPPYEYSCGTSFGDGGGDNSLDIDIRIHLNKTIHHFDNVAQFGAYPWMAAVLEKKNGYSGTEFEYKCGGSLIHRQVVMTAAHCVDFFGPRQVAVRLGEWDTLSSKDHPQYSHKDFNVSDIILHDKYRIGDKNVYEDIALLILEREAILDYHINTVCLPQQGQSFVNHRCYATGWGRDHFGKGEWQAILKEIDLPIIDRRSCQRRLRGTRLRRSFCLHDTFLCAGGEPGKDTCSGDGGSPLVCFDNNGIGIQVGIVAWGIGCGDPIPAAYVDVARYVHWIDDTITQYFYYSNSAFNYNWNVPYSYQGAPEFQQCIDRQYNRRG